MREGRGCLVLVRSGGPGWEAGFEVGEGGDLGVVAAVGDVVADHGPSHADGGADQDRRQRVPRQLAEARTAHGAVSGKLRTVLKGANCGGTVWLLSSLCTAKQMQSMHPN